jgi:hypothetical protein
MRPPSSPACAQRAARGSATSRVAVLVSSAAWRAEPSSAPTWGSRTRFETGDAAIFLENPSWLAHAGERRQGCTLQLRVAVCFLASASALSLQADEARACSCNTRLAGIFWPAEGAVDVALDTPIVVSAFQVDHVRAALLAEDGTSVPLVSRGRSEPEGTPCSRVELGFLAPASPLRPNASYRLSTKLEDGTDASSEPGRSVTFRTGSAFRDPTPPSLTYQLFAQETGKQRLLELYVEAQSASEEPLFAIAQGERGAFALNLNWRSGAPARIPLGAVDCAELTILDAAATPVSTQELCQPDKCLRKAVYADDTCGGDAHSGLDWAGWQLIPDGCSDADTTVVTTADSVESAPASGCGLAHAPTTRHWSVALLALALALALAACGRRAGPRLRPPLPPRG